MGQQTDVEAKVTGPPTTTQPGNTPAPNTTGEDPRIPVLMGLLKGSIPKVCFFIFFFFFLNSWGPNC